MYAEHGVLPYGEQSASLPETSAGHQTGDGHSLSWLLFSSPFALLHSR
jgi:hypothetical protein